MAVGMITVIQMTLVEVVKVCGWYMTYLAVRLHILTKNPRVQSVKKYRIGIMVDNLAMFWWSLLVEGSRVKFSLLKDNFPTARIISVGHFQYPINTIGFGHISNWMSN